MHDPAIPFAQFSHFLAVSVEANELFWGWFTNSVLVAAIVVGIITLLAQRAMRRPKLIPSGLQNGFEFVIEFLYKQVESILGPKVAKRAFPLLATIFIFVLLANWLGLFPGVGTIGWGEGTGPLSVSYVDTPLFRPATADLNMTLGMAMAFFIVWTYLTVTEIGVMGFIEHTFAPKGGLTGALRAVLVPIFLFVGLIEVISIAFRPVSLSLRLYGNVFAGENLLHTMGSFGGFIGAVLFPLPFYALELLVGVLQAIVFSLLCAVYIQLSTTHDEEAH